MLVTASIDWYFQINRHPTERADYLANCSQVNDLASTSTIGIKDVLTRPLDSLDPLHIRHHLRDALARTWVA